MNIQDPRVIAAVISAAVSIVTVLLSFLLKAWFEKHFVMFKLEAEHRYEQKKKIKEVIAKHKSQLLDAAETLNHRLWNFADNYVQNWHEIPDISTLPQQYYLASFTYRMLALFAWIRKIEKEMVYLDTTVASRTDLNFVKFLRVFSQMMCDVVLFKGLPYDNSYATDHFFRNDFDHMCDCFWNDAGVISYSDFKANRDKCLEEATRMVEFLNRMHPDESRFRWDRLQALHYLLLMFLNTYGYDFQYTERAKVKVLVGKSPRPNRTLSNLRHMLSRVYLDQLKQVKQILAAL
jgi:hypothetical protein